MYLEEIKVATRPVAGVSGAYDGDNINIQTIVIFFCGLTMYNSIELLALVCTTFKVRSGLYFWSLFIASAGLIPYALGFTLKFMGFMPGDSKWFAIVLLEIGWWTMVTGQSVVLWSRLHLIVVGDRGRIILKATKWMIIVDAIVLHGSTTVVTFGSNGSIATAEFVKAYNVIEKFQMTAFW